MEDINPEDLEAALGPLLDMMKQTHTTNDVTFNSSVGNLNMAGLIKSRAEELLNRTSLSTNEIALLHALLNYRGNL